VKFPVLEKVAGKIMYTTNDPISDMLTRIRNASAVKKTDIILPYSKIKMTIAELLEREGYLNKAEKIEPVQDSKKMAKQDNLAKFQRIRLVLKYKDGQPAITWVKRVSKPGRRIYKKKDELPIILNGLGLAIMSTPRGIMTNKEAKKAGQGGEFLFEVY